MIVTERLTDFALPPEVVRKRYEIIAAADARAFEAVARLAAEDFAYTFGAPQPGGAAAHWRQLERDTDLRPLAVLAGLLRLPYTLHRGVYVWPFAFDKQRNDLTDYEGGLLQTVGGENLADDFADDAGYLGWRVGIEPDGDWIFFIAGD